MLPVGIFMMRDIKSVHCNSYVLVVESNGNFLSVLVTDVEKLFIGEITLEDFKSVSVQLQITTEDVMDFLRTSIKNNALELKDSGNWKELSFQLIKGEKRVLMSTKLGIIGNPEEKIKKIKSLLLETAVQFNNQATSNEVHEKSMHTKVPQPMDFDYRDLMPQKRTKKAQSRSVIPGMSIVNPASKRIKGKPGVIFSNGSDDSDD